MSGFALRRTDIEVKNGNDTAQTTDVGETTVGGLASVWHERTDLPATR